MLRRNLAAYAGEMQRPDDSFARFEPSRFALQHGDAQELATAFRAPKVSS